MKGLMRGAGESLSSTLAGVGVGSASVVGEGDWGDSVPYSIRWFEFRAAKSAASTGTCP